MELRAWFRLCILLGIPTVEHAQQIIGYRQFIEWMAFLDIDPHGEERADMRAGIVAATIANAHSKRRFTAGDFMPKFAKNAERKAMTPDQIKGVFNTAIAARKKR